MMIAAPNMMHTVMVFIETIISQEFCLNLLIISLRLNQFTGSFTKIFSQKKASSAFFVISRTANVKY